MSQWKNTRGIRNNNPGNIDYNPANKWQGMLSHDPAKEARFCRFERPEHGIRALVKILGAYYKRHNLRTVRGIINRYAPPTENQTATYAGAVARSLGVDPDDTINWDRRTANALTRAVIAHENGIKDFEWLAKNIHPDYARVDEICAANV